MSAVDLTGYLVVRASRQAQGTNGSPTIHQVELIHRWPLFRRSTFQRVEADLQVIAARRRLLDYSGVKLD
jgi:hypothetical protein